MCVINALFNFSDRYAVVLIRATNDHFKDHIDKGLVEQSCVEEHTLIGCATGH